MAVGIALQILTTVIGASAVFLVGRKASYYRWGYVVGLCSQIFWILLFLHYGQYYMLAQIPLYGGCWYLGAKNHF